MMEIKTNYSLQNRMIKYNKRRKELNQFNNDDRNKIIEDTARNILIF